MADARDFNGRRNGPNAPWWGSFNAVLSSAVGVCLIGLVYLIIAVGHMQDMERRVSRLETTSDTNATNVATILTRQNNVIEGQTRQDKQIDSLADRVRALENAHK